jgi:hypothetical protein
VVAKKKDHSAQPPCAGVLRAWAGQSRMQCDRPAAKSGRGCFNGCATAVLFACAAAACATPRPAPPARRDSRTFPLGRPGLMRLRGGREDAADDEDVMCGGHGIEERTADNFEGRGAGGAGARARARGRAPMSVRLGAALLPPTWTPTAAAPGTRRSSCLCRALLCSCTSAMAWV